MDRIRRNAVNTWSSNVPRTCNRENKNNLQGNRTPPDKSVDENILSFYHVNESYVKLVDIGESLSNKRTVLGDKSNKSPMLRSHSKQKTKTPALEEKKMTTRHSSKRKVVDNTSLQPQKLSASKKLSFNEKYPLEGMPCSNELPKNHTNSPDTLDKCVYAKVQRQSVRNKNMPVEEKLAQYEFEVDENEPTGKKKTKKKYNRKKKVKSSDESYHPPGNVFKHILKVGCELAEKDIKEKPRRVLAEQNEKLKFESSVDCHADELKENTFFEPIPDYKDIQTTASSVHSPVRKSHFSFLENETPIRPNDHKTQERINVQGLEKDCSELEISATEKNSACNFRVYTPSRLSCPELNVSLGSCVTEDHASEKRLSNVTDCVNSPARLQSNIETGNISVSTPKLNDVQNQNVPLRKFTYSLTPVLSSLSKNDKTKEVDPQSPIDRIVTHPPVPWSLKVNVVPRVSGGANNHCSSELAKEWSIDNCFGFEDNSDETEVLSPLPNISLKQRLKTTSPISSTPLFESRMKPDRLSSYFKRRRESPEVALRTELPKSAAKVIEPVTVSPRAEKIISFETTKGAPFTNPLKQSTLNFKANNSGAPLHETPKKDRENSPLLFKEPEDNVPTHFKVPARRSYLRSVRKKMKPLGDEWIEVDTSESEEDHENELRTKRERRTKRTKLNKQEEKEAHNWIKNFNNQCEEIEEFELCVE